MIGLQTGTVLRSALGTFGAGSEVGDSGGNKASPGAGRSTRNKHGAGAAHINSYPNHCPLVTDPYSAIPSIDEAILPPHIRASRLGCLGSAGLFQRPALGTDGLDAQGLAAGVGH